MMCKCQKDDSGLQSVLVGQKCHYYWGILGAAMWSWPPISNPQHFDEAIKVHHSLVLDNLGAPTNQKLT